MTRAELCEHLRELPNFNKGKLAHEAADLIDRLAAENAELRAQIVVTDSMVRKAIHLCPLDLPNPQKWRWMANHISKALAARPNPSAHPARSTLENTDGR